MNTLFTPQKYLDAFIKTAQYLASLTSQQDLYSEVGKMVIHFFGADLAGFAERLADGEVEGHDWILPEEVSYESVFTGKTKDRINDVLESGFFSVHQIHTPDQYSLVILPIRQENLSTTVLMIGYRMSGPIPKELLNVYMAVAGLVGITTTELSSKEALRKAHDELEVKVAERTEELRARASELMSLFENSPDIITIVDREVVIQYINRTAEPYTPEDVIGTNMFDIPGTSEEYHRAIDWVLDGKGPYSFENSWENVHTHETIWYENRVAQIDSEGINDRCMIISTEITERKQIEAQMVRQERLAVLGQLAGGVGHELRNPLGAIKNAAYFLNIALEDIDPEVKRTLVILEKEVSTSERIINSLLDYARAKPPTKRKTDINQVVQGALSRIKIPDEVEVQSQLDEVLPSVLADPDQLVQVFGNIILNAVQAMPEGGRLTVTSESLSPESVKVSITDTGIGIPPENLGKIWDPLFTTKAKGIGLGLPIIKTIVEAHGGTIEVESAVGEGSTFTVNLPLGHVEGDRDE